MSFSPTSGQVVLKEVFDEGSVPTEEEIYDYALRIGIDVDTESHLLYLARDGLMQALPSGWKPCYDKDKKEIYYFNFKTKKAQWDHPLDDIYRNLVRKARSESVVSEVIDEDSRTSIKEDLKSFEEASLISTANVMFNKPKKLEPLSPLGKSLLKKVPTVLSPIKKSSSKDLLRGSSLKSALHIDEDSLLQKSESDELRKRTIFEDTEVRKRPNSSDIRNRRNIGPMEFRHLSKQEIINFPGGTKKQANYKGCSESPSEIKGSESNMVTRDEGYATEFSVSSLGEKDPGGGKKELTLAGGGSIFLKSNKTKFSPSSDIMTSSFSREESSEGLLSPELRKSGNELDSHLKSILRDQTGHKSGEKASLVGSDKKSRGDDVDEDRKSVRFNLEKDLKISYDFPKSERENLTAPVDKKKSENISLKGGREKSEARQIEIDFDDLNICLSDEKSDKVGEGEKMPMETAKTVKPKKFRPSQMLVNEYREIFDSQPKYNINLMDVSKVDVNGKRNLALEPPPGKTERSRRGSNSSSNSNSIASGTSLNEGNPLSDRQVNSETKIAKEKVTTTAKTDEKEAETKKIESVKSKDEKSGNDKIFDSAFDELVDFAIKKKLDSLKGSNTSRSKISYRERDYLLEDILKAGDSDSAGEESEGDKLFTSEEKELEYLEKLESQIRLKAQRRKDLEDDLINTEKMRNDKLNELEREYKLWLKETEDSYADKKRETSNALKKQYEKWKKERESELEKTYKEKCEGETESRINELKKEMAMKENMEFEKIRNQYEEEQRERIKKLKEEFEVREGRELGELRKSFEGSLNEKKEELMKAHKEEMNKIEKDLEDFFSEQKSQKLKELELVRENEKIIEAMRSEMKESYQKQKNALMKEHETLIENLKREHVKAMEEIKSEFKNEEESLRRVCAGKLGEAKTTGSQIIVPSQEKKNPEIEVGTTASEYPEPKVFDKVRSEKRLLEDKYKTLKEKYVKLKTEAKSTLERKKKKKDSSATATGSETENHSAKASLDAESHGESPDFRRKRDPKEEKWKKQPDYAYHDFSTEDEENVMSSKNFPYFHQKSAEISHSLKKLGKNEKLGKSQSHLYKSKEDLSGEEKKSVGHETKKKKQLFSRFKAVSTSKINSSNKNQGKEVLSPVENLRSQLKKLEELEDQFPVATYTDTYMRYPFTDNAQFGSSEIKFFKHRIHLERESVRRAKDSLKAQKKSFENRQRELKQKLMEGETASKATIEQIYQEEKELTDIEVSVYRTRALLGEKIIRLRHLEQSLKRISQPSKKGKDFLERLGVRNQSKDDEKTLSDLSSYSGSSGFSSTDFNETNNVGSGLMGKMMNTEQNRQHFQNSMQESSEIIQSLENLNAEIREIWEVLKKQQGQETLPPPPLIYGDIKWSGFTLSPSLPYRNTFITYASNLQRPVAQQFKAQITNRSDPMHVSAIVDSSLVDRTKSLRDWLKRARISAPSEAIASSQVTL